MNGCYPILCGDKNYCLTLAYTVRTLLPDTNRGGTMEYGLNRKERIEVRVSPEELDIIKRMAEKNGVSTSDYLRGMGLWEAVKKGDRKALQYLRRKLSLEARELRDRFYAAVGLPSTGR